MHDSAGLLSDALALAVQMQHPAYDCFYLALAQRSAAPLVTADQSGSMRAARTLRWWD